MKNIIIDFIHIRLDMQLQHIHKENEMPNDSIKSCDQLIVDDEKRKAEVEENKNSHDDTSLKEDEKQDHLLIGEILTESQIEKQNQETEEQGEQLLALNSGTGLSLEEDATLSNSRETYLLWLKDDKWRKELQNELLDVWLNPAYIARKLKEGIECAEKVWNDWTILPDYDAKLRYIKEAEKLLWYTKKEPVEIVFRPITNPQNPI